jgi:hypothetical protein
MNEEPEIRVLSRIMLPKGKPIFSESAIICSIEDDAAGEYIKLTSLSESGGEVCFDPHEWATLRAMIDSMVGDIQKREDKA